MSLALEPVSVDSLKDACVAQLERLILSGEVRCGQRLPPERKLAEMLGVSRPVVHEALVELAAKGLVSIEPRKGVLVNDFRTSGSVALLSSLLSYSEGRFETSLQEGLVEMRLLLESETARLAAGRRDEEQLQTLREIVALERATDAGDSQRLNELHFRFHQQIAIASGNLMYALIINSFRAVYLNLAGQFLARRGGVAGYERVMTMQDQLIDALDSGDGQLAATIMTDMVRYGAASL